MPKSSSTSSSITPMNPVKIQSQALTLTPALALPAHSGGGVGVGSAVNKDYEGIFHSQDFCPQALLLDDKDDAERGLHGPMPNSEKANITRSLAEFHPLSPFSTLLFRDPEVNEEEEEEEDDGLPATDAGGEYVAQEERKPDACLSEAPAPSLRQIDPSPHVSSQFYTFNRDSHALMMRCILEERLAASEEIRRATPRSVLESWRSVWKDRSEDTAYLTAWKRIQDKLHAHVDDHGNSCLYFKNNPGQCVSHVEQWQDIVASCHTDPNFGHLGLKETLDRIRQSWTVGAKFYGIPESFIRDCISSCPICSSSTSIAGVSSCSGGISSRTKRRRFEYTESIDVPAKDVAYQLQKLAAKHNVVLCIRQKYIRYKPFMAEVKDYACHRAGVPSSASGPTLTKKTRVLKREPYQSKRCGCGFRIRAIVPITNYNEKDKTFIYLEEGTAVFKLYALHSGHEPGPLDGNARIIHRVVGHKGSFKADSVIDGFQEEAKPEPFVDLVANDGGCGHHYSALQLVHELKMEVGLLEGKVAKMQPQLLASLSQELTDILSRLRCINRQQQSGENLAMGSDIAGPWRIEQSHDLEERDGILGNRHVETIEEDEADFDSALGDVVPWGRMVIGCEKQKMLLRGSCKSDKWFLKEDCNYFDVKSLLDYGEDEDLKLTKHLRHDETIVMDSNIVEMHVDDFYSENAKWYDSSGSLIL